MPAWLVWLGMINTLLCALVTATHFQITADTPVSALSFFLLALSAQFLLMACAITLLPYIVNVISRNEDIASGVAVLVFTLACALILTDTKVYALYRFHLNAMVLNLLFSGALQENISFSFKLWAIIALVIVMIIGGQATLILFLRRQGRLLRTASIKSILFSVLALYLGAQGVHGFNDALGHRDITSQARYVPWFQPMTMKGLMRKLGADVKTENSRDIRIPRHTALNYPKHPLQCHASPALNVVVLMVDSLRFDMLEADVMPNTTAFSRQAIRFDQHYSSGNATRFGVFGFFYGISASYWTQMLAEQRGPVLLDVLKQQQYDLHIYASAPLTSPEFDRTVFANVRNRIFWPEKKESLSDRDEWVTEQLLTTLKRKNSSKPFFAFGFYDAPHGFGLPKDFKSPFQPMLKDVNYLSLGPDSDRVPFFNLYKASVLFADQQVGRVLEHLRAQQLLEQTVVILTGDHGQEFNDLNKNFWGHNSNYSDYQVRVPMLVRWPGRAPRRETALTSHEDVVPTLIQELLGCRNNISDYSTGASLFAPVVNRALVLESWSDRAILYGNRIYRYSSYGAAEVYDKRYNALPHEVPDNHVVTEVLAKMTAFYN